MMTNTTTFRKHCLRTALLLIVAGAVLLIGLFAFSKDAGAVAGSPLTSNEVITYEPDGLLIFQFRVEQTFTVPWQYSGTDCYPTPEHGFQNFWVMEPDISACNGAYFIDKADLDIFYLAETCNVSQTFIAGQDYTVYFDGCNLIEPTHTIAQIKADHLIDLDENPAIDEFTSFTVREGVGAVLYDSEWPLTYPPTINIITPVDDSEMTSAFDITATYLNAGTHEKLMVVFESWDASSTCPVYGTDAWDDEVALGYFNHQSLPYFSDWILTDDGTTTIPVSNLEAGTYNCFKCHFITESTGAMSGSLCPEYNLDVATYIPPSYIPTFYLPITEWDTYYASTSVRWATSTPVFDNWAEAFEPIIVWVGQTAIFFEDYFDLDVAQAKGEEIGDAIAVARGYLESIDDFFGGLPLSSIFLFYIITALVVIIYRLIRGILNIIVP